MTNRELFKNIMNYKKADKVPVYMLEKVTEQALRKWYKYEGIPLGVGAETLLDFDCDVYRLRMHNLPPIPAYVPKTISTDEKYKTYINEYGFTVKVDKYNTVSPMVNIYTTAPMKTKEDWEEMKKRYSNPLDPRRFPLYWGEEYFEYLNSSSDPVTITFNWGPGRGIKNFYMFGLERWVEIITQEPELMKDMFDFWADYLITWMKSFIDKINIEAFYFAEDGMGYKTSTIISPDMYRKIYMPYVRRVTDFLHSKGINLIGYFSSGNLIPLIPCFLEAGINILAPVECAAGMDVIELRKEFGKDLRMIGNISREAVMKDREAIYEEVMRKVPRMMEEGGYIPGIDDMILPDMTFDNVKYCIELIKSIVV